MLDDSGSGFGDRTRRRTVRRKRVQKSALPRRDHWDLSRNEVSHHSRRRLKRYRGRRFIWFFQVIVFLSLGMCIPYAVKWTYDTVFYKNEELRLNRLVIQTSGTLTEAEIAAASGIQTGASLTRLRLAPIEDRIRSMPGVESAEVTRQLPDSLVIKVNERVAEAWLSCPDHGIRPLRDNGFLIDRNAVVFPCYKMTEILAGLPTIEVQGIARPVEGSPVRSTQVAESLKLIEANQFLFEGQGMEIIDVRALSNWGLLCRYPGDLLVTFDLNRIEGGLLDLIEILRVSRDADVSLATVNLVTVKNIPVTFHSNFDVQKWKNSSAKGDRQDVKRKNEMQEKHLRSILGGG